MTPAELLGWEALTIGADVYGLEALLNRPSWMRDAACREHPEVNFHLERGESAAPAKLVCRGCLVRDDCLSWALADPHPAHGILGGLSPRERQRLRRSAA